MDKTISELKKENNDLLDQIIQDLQESTKNLREANINIKSTLYEITALADVILEEDE